MEKQIQVKQFFNLRDFSNLIIFQQNRILILIFNISKISKQTIFVCEHVYV
jgi:hypothetical protein